MKSENKDKLMQLKLPAFVEVFDEIMANSSHNLSLEESLAMMVDRELILRDNRRLARLLKSAKLRYPSASIHNIDFSDRREFNKEQVRELTHCDWVQKMRNVILTGPTGSGKSYLACALGHQACQKGFRTKYFRVTRLIEQLRLSHADGSYTRLLEQLAKIDLLILDDWGIDQLDRQGRRDLLEVLEDRYAKSSTIITAQLPTDHWHNFIGDDTIADAVCDRVMSNSYRLTFKGDSLRDNKNLTHDGQLVRS